MKVVEGIMATNEVTRKQDIMADSALEDALEQLKTRGNPLLISHDWHRLTGWVQGGTLVNDGDILKLVGYSLLPETDEEEQYIVAQTDGLLQQRFEFFLSEAHQQLSQIKGLSEAAKLLLTNGTNCLAIFQPNIAEQLAPNIFGLQDVDGLIPLSELKLDLRSMTFRHKDVVLFP